MKYNILSATTNSTNTEQSVPMVGYRFHPTDDELVSHFLKLKTLGHYDDNPPIPEIKVCDYEPWDLPGLVDTDSEDQVWYFFCPRDYKYLRSSRCNRTTRAGYWKPTGKPRKVMSKRTKKVIGTKRSLVFYLKEELTKTKWIMHEYEYALNSNMATPGNFVLCKLKSESKANKKINEGQAIDMVSASDLESQNPNEMMANLSRDFDYLNLNEMTASLTYNKGKQDGLVAFDFEDQNLEEVTTNSAGDEEKSRNYLGSFDVGNQQHPYEMAAISTSANNKLNWDFEGQNPYEKIDISAFVERVWSPNGQSLFDMSNSSNSAITDTNAAEINPLPSNLNWVELEEMLELEGEDNCNSATDQLPASPRESELKLGFGLLCKLTE